METRKVQQVGGGTYTVSIPVDWAEEHSLEAGGTAYLYTHRDGSLIVRWAETEESRLAAAEVDLGDAGRTVAATLLNAAYTAGFDRITFRAADGVTDPQRRAISDCVRRLTGVEVAEVAEDHITVLGMLNASDVSVRQSILQLQFVTLSMHEAAMGAFAGNTAEPEHIVERDDEADRLFRLVERHLNRSLVQLSELDQLGVSRPRLFEYYHTARQLERVADHAAKIARTVMLAEYTPPEALVAEIRSIGAAARGVVQDASNAVLNTDTSRPGHALMKEYEAVIADGRRVEGTLIKQSPADAVVLSRVLDSHIRTAQYGGNIAEQVVQRSVRSSSQE